MVKKFTTNIDLSKASGPDCIPVVVQKDCESELLLLYLRMLMRGLWRSINYHRVIPSVVIKFFRKRVIGSLINSKNMTFFLISSMVSGLLSQLQTFWQLYLIELLGLLTGLGLFELWHLIFLRHLTGCSTLVFFTNPNFMEFQVGSYFFCSQQ